MQTIQSRTDIDELREIPNVGPATVNYLNMLGINRPVDLIGQNPYLMYTELCALTGKRFDPCLADIFISAVKYMEGAPRKNWWAYTKERKAVLSKQITDQP